jgi:hypothetical protein
MLESPRKITLVKIEGARNYVPLTVAIINMKIFWLYVAQ